MKKIAIILTLILFIFVPNQIYAQPDIKCPNAKQLKETSIKEKDELRKALEQIVPDTYEKGELGDMFSEWEILTALPFQDTVSSKDEVYYKMAKTFCGETIANKSWLVRLYFPKWEGKSASALEGQIFLAQNKDDEWFVWFRYH
ncbi:hypothetical protein [Oceanobacillus senegalensis]|uniref:hypothetical protein n=1 Tax=Oceanobacillus senegalensis TaxID=1936063 RepID=UPI000A3142EB|nr:hypothetical protein [Oceanobacillus senegalensis]